jgi:hypothetical protein
VRILSVVSIGVHHGFRRSVLLFAALAALLGTSGRAWAAASGCEARAAHAQQVLLGAQLDSWEPLNDLEVLIWTTHSTRADLVRLAKPLHGLGSAAVIDLVDGDHDGSISPCGHDGIRLGGGMGGGTMVRIVSIRLLSEGRTAELDRGARVTVMELARA